jgi:hypothetical protein
LPLRASAQPRIQAYREVGWGSREDDVAYINACRLERRPEIRDRIAYLTRQEEDLVVEKRRRIEEQLWAIHEADIGDFFETVEVAKGDKDSKAATDETGKMLTVKKQRPRLLSDLPPDLRKAIEHVRLDAKGNVVPQLYSRLQANQELRKMLNIGSQTALEADVSRLSDVELIAQLSETAKELGVDIDLNFRFAQRPAAETGGQDSHQVIDSAPAAAPATDPMTTADAQAARELTIGATPAGARKHKTARSGKR